MRIVEKRLEDLRPYKNNPRKNEAAVDKVAASIREFGFKVPLVITQDGEIVAGHTRLLAAKQIGLQKVPCIIANDLTEAQIRAYRLADNKTAEFAEWDLQLLELELSAIEEIDMTAFGFLEEKREGVIEDDYDKEPPENPKAKRGNIWQLGRHRLMCGDSTSPDDMAKLMDGRAAGLVVTDPPYNMAYEGAGRSKDRKNKRILNDKMPAEHFRDFLTSFFGNTLQVMDDGATIYSFYKELGEGVFMQAMKDAGILFKQELIWVKNQIVLGGGKYQNMYEPCLMGCKGKRVKTWNGKRKERSVIESIDLMTEDDMRAAIRQLTETAETDILRENKPLRNDLHPTMKPVKLIARLIQNSSNEGDAVLDPFGGSGTTMIAAEQIGRCAHLMEMDEKYADVIIDRWETFTGQQAKQIA